MKQSDVLVLLPDPFAIFQLGLGSDPSLNVPSLPTNPSQNTHILASDIIIGKVIENS
jgi:hypothetical protein